MRRLYSWTSLTALPIVFKVTRSQQCGKGRMRGGSSMIVIRSHVFSSTGSHYDLPNSSVSMIDYKAYKKSFCIYAQIPAKESPYDAAQNDQGNDVGEKLQKDKRNALFN
ncbi:hypothetical protein E5288_WYG002098 [Bos mutus]|uniref:Uncharacterized protein n=1 Tax=Bos mutus TaxID=72004 RepID=A0A6B0R7B5_9CETA|nr:hypothetical protein [Bos mutus]